MRPLRRISVTLLAAALLAGCGATPSPAPAATPGPSTAAGGCPSAPDPGIPAGWGPPSTAPTLVPVLINQTAEMTCGANRLLFIFVDAKTNTPVGDPDRTVKVAFYNLGRDVAKPVATTETSFVWAIENERGDYIAPVTFTEAGVWGAELTTQAPGGQPETIRLAFQVAESSPVIHVGQKAPASKTPTLADAGGNVAKISTDTAPNKALYETSIAQAVAAHEPFLVAFATPKFCKTAQCGPTLDRLKPWIAKYPTVKFIHVEPYKLTFEDDQLQPVLSGDPPDLTPTDVTEEWGLVSEPFVFVVDRDGIVRSSLELIFSDAEIKAALDAVK
jgi:hypothetical protein